jgi:O-6-methylguanine DNA methyltransferase
MAENMHFLTIFPSSLGWMALEGRDGAVERLSFGHASHAGAVRAGGNTAVLHSETPPPWCIPWVVRLQAYASGTHDDFLDVPIALEGYTEFRRRVLAICRRIPRGQTITYGELAASAGSPNAVRAVGNCMAKNPLPILIPCHRVIGSDGRLHGYSAAGGLAMKSRLLTLEGAIAKPGRRVVRILQEAK